MTRLTIPRPIRCVVGGAAGTTTMTLADETETRHNHRGTLDYDDSLFLPSKTWRRSCTWAA